MNYLISHLPEVEKEVIEAVLWYEIQKKELGDELFSLIDKKIFLVDNGIVNSYN